MLAMGSEKIHPFSWRDIVQSIGVVLRTLAFCLMASCMMILHLLFLLPNLMLDDLHKRDDLKSYPQAPRIFFGRGSTSRVQAFNQIYHHVLLRVASSRAAPGGILVLGPALLAGRREVCAIFVRILALIPHNFVL